MLKDPIALSHGTLPQWDNALGICHLHVSSDRSCSASIAFLLRFHWILSLLFWITSILVYHNTLHQQITWQIRCCAEKVLLLEMTKSADWSFHWCPLVFKWKKYLRNIFLCTFIQIMQSPGCFFFKRKSTALFRLPSCGNHIFHHPCHLLVYTFSVFSIFSSSVRHGLWAVFRIHSQNSLIKKYNNLCFPFLFLII